MSLLYESGLFHVGISPATNSRRVALLANSAQRSEFSVLFIAFGRSRGHLPRYPFEDRVFFGLCGTFYPIIRPMERIHLFHSDHFVFLFIYHLFYAFVYCADTTFIDLDGAIYRIGSLTFPFMDGQRDSHDPFRIIIIAPLPFAY